MKFDKGGQQPSFFLLLLLQHLQHNRNKKRSLNERPFHISKQLIIKLRLQLQT
jgi:hypothetical protein